MKKILSAAAVAIAVFTACSNSSKQQFIEPVSAENSGVPSIAPSVADTPQVPPAVNSNAMSPPSTPASAQTKTATAQGMNPPHGQPGHRCDIAVGVPLNSPPAAPPSPAPPSTPQSSGTPTPSFSPTPLAPVTVPPSTPSRPAAPPPAPVVTAPGMNPPHGQPGHDCTIAVGAPLKKTTDSTGKK